MTTTNLQMTAQDKVKLLNGKDKWNTRDFKELTIESLKMADGPHGLRVEIEKKADFAKSEKATCFPTSAALGCTWNVNLAKEVGTLIGEEAALAKVNVVLAPGVNIKRNPLCGRNFEYFAEDPYLAGKLGASLISGIQKNNTAACVKHFAANNQEHRRMNVNAVIDERALREIYLTPFEMAVKEGDVKMLMTSYNKLNGEYTGQSKRLITDILRKDWGYNGVVVSDWGATLNQTKTIKAGGDITMPCSSFLREQLAEDLTNGTITEEEIDKSVQRIMDLYDYCKKPRRAGESGVELTYNRQVALRCAEESIVLLKNQGVLPLKHYQSLLFTGDQIFDTVIQGGGSSRVNPYKKVNIIDCIYNYDLNIKAVEKTNFLNQKQKKNQPYTPPECDVCVVILGYPDYYETEGKDRSTLSLPQEQISAYKSIRGIYKKVVTVVISGGVVDFNDIISSDAILFVPYLGETAAEAIMNVLTGRANPSAKLSETVPISYDQVPSSKNFGEDFRSEYRESIFVGYRYYDTFNKPVLFPFGHGLSYTTFEYYNAVADKKGVTFTIKNTGDYAGAEVCQIYISKPESQIFRAKKELKGFVKVFLKAGEQKTVTIPFDDKTFRYFNVETQNFEREAGNYKIYVAASSDDIRLSVTVLLSGTAKLRTRVDLPTYVSDDVKNVSHEEFERLYGADIPFEDYNFYRKNRIKIDLCNTIADLRYSKGLIARIFGRHIYKKLKKIDRLSPKKASHLSMLANTTVFGIINHLNLNHQKAQGLLMVFNGRFIKGIFTMLKKGGSAV